MIQRIWMRSRFRRRRFAGRRRRYFRKRRFGRRRGTRSFARKVKQALLKVAETKYYDSLYENFLLFHNRGRAAGPIAADTALIWDPYAVVAQGTSVHTRIGESIVPRGIQLKLYLENAPDRPQVYYRIIVYTAPQTSNAQSSIFRPSDQAGSAANNFLRPVDTESGFRTIIDKIVRLQYSNSAGGLIDRRLHKYVRMFIRPKKGGTIKYNSAGGLLGRHFGVWVIPYDAQDSLTTDNIGYANFFMRIYWKDP